MPKFVEPHSEMRNEKSIYGALADLSQKVYQLRLSSQCHFPTQHSNANVMQKVQYKKIIIYDILHL